MPEGWVGGGLNNGTMAFASTLIPEKASPLALKPENSVPPHRSPALFRVALPLLEYWVSVSEIVFGPFKSMPGSLEALCLTWTESLLIFTVRYCGDSSFQHWWSRWGTLVWG